MSRVTESNVEDESGVFIASNEDRCRSEYTERRRGYGNDSITSHERRPYRPYWKKYRRIERSERSLKAVRNERSRWRAIGRILMGLGVNNPESLERCETRDGDAGNLGGRVAAFTLAEKRTGVDMDVYKRLVMCDSMSNDHLKSFVDVARMEGYSRLYVTSLVGSIVRTNRSLDYSFFLKMTRNKDIEASSRGVDRTIDDTRDTEESKNSNSSVVASPSSLMDRREISLKSDGILTFSPREFIRLFEYATREIRAIRARDIAEDEIAESSGNRILGELSENTSSNSNDRSLSEENDDKRRRLFLYTFFLLAVTGQRLSDVAQLGIKHLRRLRYNGVCVVRCCKTKNLMRIEIPEVLHGKGSTKRRENRDSYRDFDDSGMWRDSRDERSLVFLGDVPDDRNDRDPRTKVIDDLDTAGILAIFETWYDREKLEIPYSRTRARLLLDSSLNETFEKLFGRAKPRGLSFHALRRAFAGYKFLQGCPLETIQRNMDHASRRMTNHYINKCLYDFTNDETI